MRLTVEIDDPLHSEAKSIAARDKTTLSALVSEGLGKLVDDRRAKTLASDSSAA